MRTLLGGGIGTRLTLVAVLAIVIAGCAGAASAPAADRAPDNALSGAGGATSDGSAPMPAASAAPSAASAEGSGGSGSTTTTDSLRIVYTGSLELVVADVATATAVAKTKVEAAGGYIGASQESNQSDQPSAVITYRIPASKWEATISDLRGIAAKVVSEQTQAAEVGGQLVDLEARLANLRASETALQDIAKNTAKVSDLLEVQAQLTDVRGQIEQLDAQRAHLADQVAYGTLVTTFGLEVAQVKEVAKGWDPASEVDAASARLISVGQRLVNGLIWFVIVWLPFLLVAGVVLFVAWRVWRRFGPKRAVPAEPIAGWNTGDQGGHGTPVA